LSVGPGLQVVLELFDKEGPEGPTPFSEADRQLTGAAAELGAEVLRQALAERQEQRVLADALVAAKEVGEAVAQSLEEGAEPRPEEPPPPSVLERLREGLEGNAGAAVDAGPTLRLAEAIRVLALRYGPTAVAHCTSLVEGVRKLLDETTGAVEGSP
jgi:hypothetical protein